MPVRDSRSRPAVTTSWCGDVDVVDGDAADEVDVVADEPARAVQVELGFAAAEVALAQRGLGIRQRGVGGQDPHRDVGVLAAERLRRAQPRRTTSDGDETRCHHTSWVPLRRVERARRQRFVTFAEQRRIGRLAVSLESLIATYNPT